ncbi:NAD-binding protein [Leeia sp. TBRC 13508]|uniref:NAD-binding protein n=1 Tax=Leeia speluncae TaxID=2884804 RepID=A0ABS8D783_9NEIS|nr:potassium channel protein [Leeia speluncae]MCB6183898.1 NAD-binding protein [Leeia speluncae]
MDTPKSQTKEKPSYLAKKRDRFLAMWKHPIYRKILWFNGLLVSLVLLGTFGYMLLEGWSFFDSLYMTIITLATIGYGETHPLGDSGRLYTMLLILFGSGVMVYSITGFITSLLEGDIRKALKKMTIERAISELNQHIIICGNSQTGKYAIDELKKTKQKFVVIDNDPARLEKIDSPQILCLQGDATDESVLISAGVERATGLITTLHHDADNLFVVLTARGLNPNIRIIAKAVEESSLKKLKQVGADSVVMPNIIGGLRMVSEMVRPSVVTFLDMMLGMSNQTIRVEELQIPSGSPVIGKTLADLHILHEPDVSLVAILPASGGAHQFNPPAQTQLIALDTLILIGDASRIANLNKRLGL